MKYNKEKIKELILTDYLDGRLDNAARKEIEAAIAGNAELREFLEEAKKAVQKPFQEMPEAQPPEHVWQNIKQQIAGSRKVDKPQFDLSGFWEPFIVLWKRPRLSFRLATVTAVMIFALSIGVTQWRVRGGSYDSEQQVEYLMFLASSDLVGTEDVNGEFDTTIENYFL